MVESRPTALERLLPGRHLATLLLLTLPAAFMLTTIPGVRSEQGYNLLLDGVLNNAAYEAAALVCLLRALAQPARTWTSFLLPTALAVYGSGNVVWTVFVRPLEVQPFPCCARSVAAVSCRRASGSTGSSGGSPWAP
jgi:hypothetical protein